MKRFTLWALAAIVFIAFAVPAAAEMSLTSSVVKDGGTMPDKYTRKGAKEGLTTVSPPIEWTGAPAGTKAFVVIGWNSGTFWSLYNIPADAKGLPENAQGIGKEGVKFNTPQEGGPGTYEKHITLYALSAEVKAEDGADAEKLRAAMKSITLGTADLKYNVVLE